MLGKIQEYAHWFLRIPLALVFIYHGAAKIPMAAGMAQMMGAPLAFIYILALAEVLAGILSIAGHWLGSWATRTAGGIIAVVMLGAIGMVHWGKWVEIEFPLALLGIALYLLVVGNNE
jgi:putative oxidoreductase